MDITKDKKQPDNLTVKPWSGNLHHDRSEFADWGMIRDDKGRLVMRVVAPYDASDSKANQCRRDGTDPSQARVDAILSAVNAKADRSEERSSVKSLVEMPPANEPPNDPNAMYFCEDCGCPDWIDRQDLRGIRKFYKDEGGCLICENCINVEPDEGE